MISQQKATRKRLDKLVFAAERLAAVQYEAGLHASDEKRERVEKKVRKCWHEFRLACDALLNDYKETPTMVVRWSK